VLSALVPKNLRKRVFSILADSICRAHDVRADRWGIRVSPGSVMLKVGRIEVLQILPSQFHVVLDSASVPKPQRRRRVFELSGIGIYKSVAGSQMCDMALSSVPLVWSALETSHQVLIQKAAATGRHSTTVPTHSPGGIQFLADWLDRRVPQPSYLTSSSADVGALPQEVTRAEEYVEGAVLQVLVNRFERDPSARATCVARHGTRCAACGLSLADAYGPSAAGLIHVHHLLPLSEVGSRHKVDPVRDLRPICPNCHAVVHSTRPAFSVEEVAALVAKYRGA
jgi:hypothetical protein